MAFGAVAFCFFSYTNLGLLILTEHEGYVRIKGTVYDLPKGKHGLLLHENEVTNGHTCENLGEHFDYPPHGHQHGSHSGDLGNIDAIVGGEVLRTYAKVDTIVEMVSLERGKSSLINRSIAIHLKRDVLKPGHDEDSGPPIACCTIRKFISKRHI